MNNGGLFTVATGRTELNIKPFLKELPINCPAILYNGAAIYDLKKKNL
ncbi:HAD family hydrolase [Caloramator sp. mosi_1]